MKGYVRLRGEDGFCYVKKGCAETLRQVDAAIFDCDGVLVDVAPSYDRAISKTVSLLIGKATGARCPSSLISRRIVYELRNSGGFNNDWDACYVILIHLFSHLPSKVKESFRSSWQSLDSTSKQLPKVLCKLDSKMRMQLPDKGRQLFQEGLGTISEYVGRADSRGVRSLEPTVPPEPSLEAFKQFLSYPGLVGESLLATVFDEIFLGPTLFSHIHGMETRLKLPGGMVEGEKVLIRRKTMERLTSKFGPGRLGIASGRGFEATKATMKDLLSYFNREASVFLEDELSVAGVSVERVRDCAKPQPYSLLKASEPISERSKTLYVGDSAEDLLMVENANKLSNRFVFAGVYGTAPYLRERVRFFVNLGADLVVKSVNDLPDMVGAW